MIFRQLIDQATSTFTYLLADEETKEAVLIDCVYEQHLRDLALIRELGLSLSLTLETHVHADHVTGAWLLKEALGCRIGVAAAAAARGCDLALQPGQEVRVGSLRLEVRATPGHTDGCLTFVSKDKRVAFTGDALLIRGAGRTDFQGGDPARLFQSVRQQIFTLPDDCTLYPAHDYNGRTSTTVGEEKSFNPRLGERVREADFVGYMNHLGLPHPKKMDAAVPANLLCGKPSDDRLPLAPTWGPVIRTYAGVWQVEPEWVFSHRLELTIVDVREREEIAAEPLGLVPESLVIPLSELRAGTMKVTSDKPVVTICPSGARSAIAAGLLEKNGVKEVANLRGGLLGWKDLGYPVELG